MKKKLTYSIILGALGLTASAQVGIGNTSPNPSSQLEITATDKGVLFPRITLRDNTDTSTIKEGNINSLFVYNTATVAGSNAVNPGYYYWNQNKWVRLATIDDLNNTATTGSITFDTVNNTFHYTDENGMQQTININEIVKGNETLTSLVAKGTTLEYTDEKTNVNTIDLTDLVKEIIVTESATIITNNLVNDGTNTITSTVNGVSKSVGVVNNVANSLVGTKITTTVNGIAGAEIDLTSAITAATTTLITKDFEIVNPGEDQFDLTETPTSILTFFVNGQRIKNAAITTGNTTIVTYVPNANNGGYRLKAKDIVTIQYIK